MSWNVIVKLWNKNSLTDNSLNTLGEKNHVFHWCHCENHFWNSTCAAHPFKVVCWRIPKKHQKNRVPAVGFRNWTGSLITWRNSSSCSVVTSSFPSLVGGRFTGWRIPDVYYCKERAQATFNIHKKTTKNTGRWINKNHVAPRKLPPWPSHPCCQRNDCLKSYHGSAWPFCPACPFWKHKRVLIFKDQGVKCLPTFYSVSSKKVSVDCQPTAFLPLKVSIPSLLNLCRLPTYCLSTPQSFNPVPP